jgi:hypothetical protein
VIEPNGVVCTTGLPMRLRIWKYPTWARVTSGRTRPPGRMCARRAQPQVQVECRLGPHENYAARTGAFRALSLAVVFDTTQSLVRACSSRTSKAEGEADGLSACLWYRPTTHTPHAARRTLHVLHPHRSVGNIRGSARIGASRWSMRTSTIRGASHYCLTWTQNNINHDHNRQVQ